MSPGGNGLCKSPLRTTHTTKIDVEEAEIVQGGSKSTSQRFECLDSTDVEPSTAEQAERRGATGPEETSGDFAGDVGGVTGCSQEFQRWTESGEDLGKARGALTSGIEHAKSAQRIIETTGPRPF